MSETYHRPITEAVPLCEDVAKAVCTIAGKARNISDLMRQPYILRDAYDSAGVPTGYTEVRLSDEWSGVVSVEWLDNCLVEMYMLMLRLNKLDKALGRGFSPWNACVRGSAPSARLQGFLCGADNGVFNGGYTEWIILISKISCMYAAALSVRDACAEAQLDRARRHMAVLEEDFFSIYCRMWASTSAMHRLHAGAARVTHMCAQMCREGMQ